MSKPIENKQLVTSVVHKTITFTTESGGVTASAYQSGSDSETSLSGGAIYNHINWNFYKTHDYPGSSGNGNTYVYGSDDQQPHPVHKNKFNDKGVVFSISSSKFGRKIEPGTLEISGNLQQAVANQIYIKDDGYGNLYPINADITQSGATSLSSSDNYVGNVFYEYGIAILTETSSYKTNFHYTSSNIHHEVKLKTTVDINTLYIDCAMEANEYNMTMNPSTLSGSDSPISLTNFDDSRRDGIYTNQDTYPRLFTDSGSTYKMENNKYSNTFRSNDFRTYVTKIGLYNEDGEMIAMASPSRPLQKLIDQRMVIRIQLDFLGKY